MNRKQKYAGWTIAVGAALGAVFGAIAGNMGVWLAVGVAIGVAIGSTMGRKSPACPRCAELNNSHPPLNEGGSDQN